jgi:hypothetical protein
MFDEERCRGMEVRIAARVDCEALQRVRELLKQRKSPSRRDGIVEDQQLLGGADAEASKSSTSSIRFVSSQSKEARLAKPIIGDSRKNAELTGATVASIQRKDAGEESKGGRQ